MDYFGHAGFLLTRMDWSGCGYCDVLISSHSDGHPFTAGASVAERFFQIGRRTTRTIYIYIYIYLPIFGELLLQTWNHLDYVLVAYYNTQSLVTCVFDEKQL